MNKIRIALSVLAIVFATFAAYSFTRVPAKNAAAKSDPTDVWIKFNCSETNIAPTIVTSGFNYTTGSETTLPGYQANCPGTKSVCARKYAAADVMDQDAHNKVPKLHATVLSETKCVNFQ